MSLQVEVHTVTLRSIMRRASFVRGFHEAQNGTALDYDAYVDNPNQQWSYERGRLFGLLYKGKLKNGKALTYEAVRQMSISFRNKDIL